MKNRKTTTKTIRFPADLAETVQQTVGERGESFSSFVTTAVQAALEDLRSEKIQKSG